MATDIKVVRTIETMVVEVYTVEDPLPEGWSEMDPDDRFNWVYDTADIRSRHDDAEEVQGTITVHRVEEAK